MMRWLKFLLIILIGFCVFVFLFSLFLPSVGHTERAGAIAAPLDTVMVRLTDVHHLARWMQGWSTDSVDQSLEFQFPGEGQPCFSWLHRGLSQRRGSFCITHIIPRRQVDYRMDMPGLPPITGHFVLAPALDGQHTWIKWTMDLHLGWWPWWKYYGVMLDRLVGPGMEHALGSLKADCEQADTMGYQIHRIPVPFHVILTCADTVLISEKYQALQRAYRALQQQLARDGLVQQAPVIAQYLPLHDSIVEIHVGIPVQPPIDADPAKLSARLPSWVHLLNMPAGGYVLVASQKGPASQIPGAYHALQRYLEKQHLQSPAGPWEQYLNHLPAHDTSLVEVKVYWPVY
ncbi:MAG: SRPBCC family protein [Thermoflavifilum sp.]|nr:SRPBCC family protein [Thermoflavifilum sp.]